jgi:hypothetical protein
MTESDRRLYLESKPDLLRVAEALIAAINLFPRERRLTAELRGARDQLKSSMQQRPINEENLQNDVHNLHRLISEQQRLIRSKAKSR